MARVGLVARLERLLMRSRSRSDQGDGRIAHETQTAAARRLAQKASEMQDSGAWVYFRASRIAIPSQTTSIPENPCRAWVSILDGNDSKRGWHLHAHIHCTHGRNVTLQIVATSMPTQEPEERETKASIYLPTVMR